MIEIILVFHVLIAIVLIGLVLIQHGKGAQAGAAFGSGASQTVFGSQGSGGFLAQTTWILAGLFFVTSLSMAYLINKMTHRVVTTPMSQSVPASSHTTGEPREEVPEIP